MANGSASIGAIESEREAMIVANHSLTVVAQNAPAYLAATVRSCERIARKRARQANRLPHQCKTHEFL